MRASLNLSEHITSATSKVGSVSGSKPTPDVSKFEETLESKEPDLSESESSSDDEEFIIVAPEKLVSSLPHTAMEDAKPNEKSKNELDSWIGQHGAGDSARQPCCASCNLF